MFACFYSSWVFFFLMVGCLLLFIIYFFIIYYIYCYYYLFFHFFIWDLGTKDRFFHRGWGMEVEGLIRKNTGVLWGAGHYNFCWSK